jgi:ketosteroid isomerase-like protein
VTADAAHAFNFEDLFASIDAMDTEGFLSFIAEDGLFRFGSSPPVHGHAGIRQAVESFFATFAGLRHEVTCLIREGDRVACEGAVTYTRHDGSTITLPFANIFGLRQGLIGTYHVYIDIAPLYAQ